MPVADIDSNGIVDNSSYIQIFDNGIAINVLYSHKLIQTGSNPSWNVSVPYFGTIFEAISNKKSNGAPFFSHQKFMCSRERLFAAFCFNFGGFWRHFGSRWATKRHLQKRM